MKMNKILLLMVVLLGLFGLSGTTVLAEGADPFLISDQDSFDEFATHYGEVGYQNAKLTASFTLDDSFSQITNFSGSFDGNGQTITMGNAMTPCTKSILKTIAGSGVVKNLTVDGFIIGSSYNVGGIAAENNGSITGCSVSGSVEGTVANAGGIAGENDGSIAGCTVSASVKSGLYTGGIAGYNVSYISGCTVSGSVEGTAFNTGGIIGVNSGGTVTNAYCLKDSTNNINHGLYDIGDNTSFGTTEDNATQFTSGQIAWELRLWQDNLTDSTMMPEGLYWGQTLGTADDTYPVLTTDPAQQVYQLSFKRAGAATIDDTLSVYLNLGQSCEDTDFPAADTGFTWVDTEGNPYESSYTMPGLSDTPAPADMLLKESKEPTDVSVTSSAHAVVNDQETVTFTITNSSTSPATFRWKLNDGTWSTAITVTGGDQSPFDVTLSASNPTIYIQQEVGTDGWSLSKAVPFTITCLKTDDTNHDTIEIGSPADFNAFATYINNGWDSGTIKNAILTNDIDFNSITLTPVGVYDYNDSTFQHPYSGNFDGQNYSIKNVNIDSSEYYVGIFGYTSKATISNLTVDGSIKGDYSVGGIAGYNNEGTISACTVSGTVIGEGSTYTYVGGIAGVNNSGSISACTVSGTVTNKGSGTYTDVGGIAGYNWGSISACTVSGNVTSQGSGTHTDVGGIAGYNNEGTISACTVSGNVTGQSPASYTLVGGIAGYNSGSISACTVSGNVTSQGSGTYTYVGGIAGYNSGGTLTNAYCLKDSTKSINPGLHDIGSDASSPIVDTATQFTSGSIAWELRIWQDNLTDSTMMPDGLYWGQTLTTAGDTYPVLTKDSSQKVYQLLFYQSEADKSGGTPDDTLTCYANYDSAALNFPAPASGYCWTNGTTEFKSTDAVTSDLQLVKTAVASPPGGGGGTTTPSMTGISVQPVIIYLGQTLTADAFGITGLPAGAAVSFSTNGSDFYPDPPMPDQAGTYTFTIQITAPGYQTYSVTTTVTVLPNAIVLTPLASGSGSRPTNLSGGGFGIPYSFDLDAFLSGDATSDASAKAITSLSAASVTAYAIDSIDDPCCLLADGDNAPSISDNGLFSCYLNYANGSSSGQTATATSGNTEISTEAAAVSTESTNNMASVNASDDDASDTSDTVMLCATVLINVTLESGDITPITLDIEIPQRLYNIDYRTHIQNIGWENDFIENGQMSGTQGQGLRLEAIEIKTDSDYDLGVSYRTHVQNLGWEENYVSDGQESGTDGQGLRLEAIELSLTGADADYFDIYYQVHVQNLGWLDWASNGAPAGSAGFGYRLEGIRIVVVPKGAEAPGATDKCFIEQ